MKLNELKLQESSTDEIREFLIASGKTPDDPEFKYKNNNGMLSVDLQFSFPAPIRLKWKKLPIKFDVVNGNFLASNLTSLETLENFPNRINGALYCGHSQLTSFEHITPNIKRDVNAVNLKKFTSLLGVDQHFGKMNGALSMSFGNITEGGLGLLNVKGLMRLVNTGKDISTMVQLPKQFEIIDKHLRTDNRDIFECQSELIEAGFEEYAQL